MKNNRVELGVTVASVVAVSLFLALLAYRPVAGADFRWVPVALLVALPVALLAWAAVRAAATVFRLGVALDALCRAHGIAPADGRRRWSFVQLPARLPQTLRLLAERMVELDQQAVAAEAASRLLSYHHDKAQAVLEAMPDAVLVLDHACVATYANSKVEALLGSRHSIVRNTPNRWCANKDLRALLTRFMHEGDAAVHTESIEYSPPGRKDARVRASAYPLFSPSDRSTLFGTLVLFRDISEEHAARRSGAEFVARVSHELKTPLSTLAAYGELLTDFRELPDEERVNAVNVIRDEVERASRLIDNLLNVSRLESGSIRLVRQRVKLQELLRDSAENFNRTAQANDVRIEIAIASGVGSARLDKDLFRIAIDNLLSNAVKYSNPGDVVMLRAEHVEEDRVRVSVEDRGIGMSEEDRVRVFDKYYRSRADKAAKRGGHGLGLYLARQIVELHNGEIAVASEPGRGSTFTIEFEAQNPQLEEAETT